jgi:hypothetical protein
MSLLCQFLWDFARYANSDPYATHIHIGYSKDENTFSFQKHECATGKHEMHCENQNKNIDTRRMPEFVIDNTTCSCDDKNETSRPFDSESVHSVPRNVFATWDCQSLHRHGFKVFRLPSLLLSLVPYHCQGRVDNGCRYREFACHPGVLGRALVYVYCVRRGPMHSVYKDEHNTPTRALRGLCPAPPPSKRVAREAFKYWHSMKDADLVRWTQTVWSEYVMHFCSAYPTCTEFIGSAHFTLRPPGSKHAFVYDSFYDHWDLHTVPAPDKLKLWDSFGVTSWNTVVTQCLPMTDDGMQMLQRLYMDPALSYAGNIPVASAGDPEHDFIFPGGVLPRTPVSALTCNHWLLVSRPQGRVLVPRPHLVGDMFRHINNSHDLGTHILSVLLTEKGRVAHVREHGRLRVWRLPVPTLESLTSCFQYIVTVLANVHTVCLHTRRLKSNICNIVRCWSEVAKLKHLRTRRFHGRSVVVFSSHTWHPLSMLQLRQQRVAESDTHQ